MKNRELIHGCCRYLTSVFIEEKSINHFSTIWITAMASSTNAGETPSSRRWVLSCFLGRTIFISGTTLATVLPITLPTAQVRNHSIPTAHVVPNKTLIMMDIVVYDFIDIEIKITHATLIPLLPLPLALHLPLHYLPLLHLPLLHPPLLLVVLHRQW